MEKLFFQMPCLSESRELTSQEVFEKLFDKKVDKRDLVTAVQKFLLLNKRMLDFLGIEVFASGTGQDFSLQFKTSSRIGAVPIRMPYDGIAHKDFQVLPRFDSDKDTFAELTQILSVLDYSIRPEYFDGEPLMLPLQLRPPLYYEAAKYVELFEKAHKFAWVKFEVVSREHHNPKANTKWDKHAERAADPLKVLQFPSRDSIFSTNHKEWQELKYVLEIAQSIIINPYVPSSIRFKYQEKVRSLQRKVAGISVRKASYIHIHASDPPYIKDLKEQANVLLQKESTVCMAWRIDMAELFERYIQYIVERSTRELSGDVICNGKISGKGSIPIWGLQHLEPDIIIKFGNRIYMADAKYKAHFYNRGVKSEALSNAHRLDLHQLLAYCSFTPELNKTGILFYPANTFRLLATEYSERISGIKNRIFLCGIPFGLSEMDNAINRIKGCFQDYGLAIC